MATFPTAFKMINQPRIYSNVAVYSSDSISLIQKKRRIPAQRWEFTLDVLAHGLKDINQADAWLFKQNGSFETFTLNVDVNKKPENVGSQTALSSDALKGDSVIQVSSIANLEPGDEGFYIRVTGDTKVYMVTGISKGTGVDSLEIFPSLRRPTNSGALVFLDADFTVRIEDNITSGTYGYSRRIKNWNFKLIEVL